MVFLTSHFLFIFVICFFCFFLVCYFCLLFSCLLVSCLFFFWLFVFCSSVSSFLASRSLVSIFYTGYRSIVASCFFTASLFLSDWLLGLLRSGSYSPCLGSMLGVCLGCSSKYSRGVLRSIQGVLGAFYGGV